MKKNQPYTPARADIIKLEPTDVITTSPTFDSPIDEGEWDEAM